MKKHPILLRKKPSQKKTHLNIIRMVQIIYHAMAGFTGGLVFMYIQCKVYLQLCRKWKAYNRTIVVQVIQSNMLLLCQKSFLTLETVGF